MKEEILSGLFKNKPIMHESLITTFIILNSFSNQSNTLYEVLTNPKSLLGFLQYIYLPTTFIVVFHHNLEDGYLVEVSIIDFVNL